MVAVWGALARAKPPVVVPSTVRLGRKGGRARILDRHGHVDRPRAQELCRRRMGGQPHDFDHRICPHPGGRYNPPAQRGEVDELVHVRPTFWSGTVAHTSSASADVATPNSLKLVPAGSEIPRSAKARSTSFCSPLRVAATWVWLIHAPPLTLKRVGVTPSERRTMKSAAKGSMPVWAGPWGLCRSVVPLPPVAR